jgi:hypothetical protein
MNLNNNAWIYKSSNSEPKFESLALGTRKNIGLHWDVAKNPMCPATARVADNAERKDVCRIALVKTGPEVQQISKAALLMLESLHPTFYVRHHQSVSIHHYLCACISVHHYRTNDVCLHLSPSIHTTVDTHAPQYVCSTLYTS